MGGRKLKFTTHRHGQEFALNDIADRDWSWSMQANSSWNLKIFPEIKKNFGLIDCSHQSLGRLKIKSIRSEPCSWRSARNENFKTAPEIKNLSTSNYSSAGIPRLFFPLHHHTHHNTHKLYFAELDVTTAKLPLICLKNLVMSGCLPPFCSPPRKKKLVNKIFTEKLKSHKNRALEPWGFHFRDNFSSFLLFFMALCEKRAQTCNIDNHRLFFAVFCSFFSEGEKFARHTLDRRRRNDRENMQSMFPWNISCSII